MVLNHFYYYFSTKAPFKTFFIDILSLNFNITDMLYICLCIYVHLHFLHKKGGFLYLTTIFSLLKNAYVVLIKVTAYIVLH